MNKLTDLDLTAFPKELTLLLHLLKKDTGQKGLLHSEEWFADFDWETFVQLVIHHRVYPSIYLKLRNLPEHRIPAEIVERLRQAYQTNTFQMLFLSREMEQLCRFFAENKVACLVLKGPVVAADLYGDLSLRTSRDLDLLVQEDDLAAVEELLLQNGYVEKEGLSTVMNEWKWRKHHITFVHPQKRITVEIHWKLHPFPFKQPGFQQMWKRKRMSSVTSYPVYFLGSEDLLLFLIGHGAREGWFRLRWLLDIDYMVRKNLDWDLLNLFIQRHQQQSLVGQALILASQLLHTPIHPKLQGYVKGVRSQRLAEGALFFIEQMVELHGDDRPSAVVQKYDQYMRSLKSKFQLVLFALSLLYPSASDVETLKLPKQLHFLYFPLRPFLYLWRKTRKQASIGGFR